MTVESIWYLDHDEHGNAPQLRRLSRLPAEVGGESHANADLVAAGPDMLAALEGILADNAPQVSLADQRARWNERMDAARAAVAKARGADADRD